MGSTNFLIAMCLLISAAFACRPVLRIYESQCCGDDYIEVAREYIGIANEKNLTAKGILNLYTRTCPEGLWLGFRETDYTGMSYILSSRRGLDGVTNCRYENDGRQFKSVKIIGRHEDYTARAVVTYAFRYNEGDDILYVNDTSSIPAETFNSLVIVGNEEIELFTNTGYSGMSVCIRPNNGDIYSWSQYEEVNERRDGPELYTNLAELTAIFGTRNFGSFRYGCSNSNSAKFIRGQ